MDDTLARARCAECGGGLGFEEWSRGVKTCAGCRRTAGASPAAVYVPGPRAPIPRPTRPGIEPREAVRRRNPAGTPGADYERLLDEVPDDLIDEIVAALEVEARRLESEQPGVASQLTEVLQEIGFGRSPREFQLAAWGFAIGFGANVVLAKYAQMQTSSPMSQFIGPLLVGGLVAGAACAAIGWGFAKLRER